MTIKDLMSKAKEGDSSAYGELYQVYLTPIYRFIYFRVKNREVAEDLTQNVFLRVLEKQGGLDTDSLAKAYFYRVARNLVIDYYRKKKDLPMDFEALNFYGHDSKENLPNQVDGQLALTSIKNIIAQLDDKSQEIIILKFVNELSNKEVSELLGKTEMAIRQLQCRALKKLRKILNSYGK